MVVTKFTQAKHNIDNGSWIPLTDCEFIESTNPKLVGKTKSDGSPYGHIYCRPSVKDFIKESNDFDWIRDVEAIKSPKVSKNNRYVIWLGELEGYENENKSKIGYLKTYQNVTNHLLQTSTLKIKPL